MVFDAIAETIADRNGCSVSDITPESTFEELGIDSLDQIELLMALEDRLEREIEYDRRVETVGELVGYLEEKYGL